MKPKAIGYVRVSTGRQANEGVSIEMQKQKIQMYCDYKEYDLINILTDEGISGSGKVDRPEFENVKAYCAGHFSPGNGIIQAVVVYSLSRFTRSTRELLDFVDEYVIKKEIELHSVVEQLDTSSPTGRFMLKVMGAMNELEREQIVQRTQAALDHKKSKGEKLGGYVPYGYDVKSNGMLVINQAEQEVIATIKEYYDGDWSFNAIAKDLNDLGVPTKNGSTWNHKTVSRLIRRI
jgi:site-specific DNA recombinase